MKNSKGNGKTGFSSPTSQLSIPAWAAYLIYAATALMLAAVLLHYFLDGVFFFAIEIIAIIGLAVGCIVMLVSQSSGSGSSKK